MPRLLLAPPPPGTESAVPWRYALCADDWTPTRHGSTSLELLPRANEWVLVLPTSALSWHAITLPKAPARRLRAALDGLLEEQLLDEPAALHLALAPDARPGAPTWVAACERAWLQSLLQKLDAQPHPPLRLVPEHSPDPYPLADPLPNPSSDPSPQALPRFYLSGSPEQAWLTQVDAHGVLRLPWSSQLPMSAMPTPEASVQAEPALAAQAEQWLRRKVQLLHPAQILVDAARSNWDLAQFGLLPAHRARWARRGLGSLRRVLYEPQWRALRWGAVALVLVNLMGLNLLAWTQSRAALAQRAALGSLLVAQFPAVQLVLDAPLQMQRELDRLQAGTGSLTPLDLESMLARVGPLLPPGSAPTGLRFTRGELSLQGLAPDVAQSIQAQLHRPSNGLGYSSHIDGSQLVLQAQTTP